MFSFPPALLFFLTRGVLAQIDTDTLNLVCNTYYHGCSGDCETYKDEADAACNSESSNHDYGMCFYNHDESYLADQSYKRLAVCLVENTKSLSDFTCFNNATTVVSCPSDITANMNFNLASGGSTTIEQYQSHDATLTIDWGDMNVILKPINWDGCSIVNEKSTCETLIGDMVPHMNLHACHISQTQPTCSALMLESAQANATVDFTTNNMGGAGSHDLSISFDQPGLWRLLGHIQIYEIASDNTKIKWDIANAIEITVTAAPVTPTPTAQTGEAEERKTGGNNVALIICLLLVAICAGGCGYCYFCGVGESFDEDYDAAAQDEYGDDYVQEGKEEVDLYTGPAAVEMENPNKTPTKDHLTAVPKMDTQSSPLFAKLMAKSTITGSKTSEPRESDLPPPPSPGANVV